MPLKIRKAFSRLLWLLVVGAYWGYPQAWAEDGGGTVTLPPIEIHPKPDPIICITCDVGGGGGGGGTGPGTGPGFNPGSGGGDNGCNKCLVFPNVWRDTNVNCSDSNIAKNAALRPILAAQPGMRVGTQVTLLMAFGQSQGFRFNGLGVPSAETFTPSVGSAGICR